MQLQLASNGKRITWHNVTEQVKAFIQEADIQNGVCVVQSPHTTCSVIFEEYTHDHDFNGDEYLLVDMSRILDKIVPRELTENTEYKYPGPKHVEFLHSLQDNPAYKGDAGTILNGDAHIRASLFGASETFTIVDGVLQTGDVGYIYFVDWDQNRVRTRQCNVLVMGE
jgi:thiamine phosphate synthase YjbQ (UPF0047 family)